MRIFVAGHRGMVGSAILRQLEARQQAGEEVEILTVNREDVDLTDQQRVSEFINCTKPDVVILAAAKVGGIHANNTYPAEFIYDNLMIQTNVVHQSYCAGVSRLLLLGSSCIYPREAKQPMTEELLLTGPLEPTNEPYAVAKIAGLKLCESYNRQYGVDYRCVMPTNLYGPGDNFHPQDSHVLPALLLRFHQAVCDARSEVQIWGTGTPMREFLHVDDMASASLHVLDLPKDVYDTVTQPMQSHINVGTGKEISILNLAKMTARVTGFEGRTTFDETKPDGSRRKLLDVTRLATVGWEARIPLEQGLKATYEWFLGHEAELRGN